MPWRQRGKATASLQAGRRAGAVGVGSARQLVVVGSAGAGDGGSCGHAGVESDKHTVEGGYIDEENKADSEQHLYRTSRAAPTVWTELCLLGSVVARSIDAARVEEALCAGQSARTGASIVKALRINYLGHKIQPGGPGAEWGFRYFSGSPQQFRWCGGTLRQKRIDGSACKEAGASTVLATFPALLGTTGASSRPAKSAGR